MILGSNQLYISNDYTNWKIINMPYKDIKFNNFYKNQLNIIGNNIYLCDPSNYCIYYTDYININWKKMDNIRNEYYIGIVSKLNDNNTFIIYTSQEMCLTKDGGKTFTYLLNRMAVDNFYEFSEVDSIEISSDKIYFSTNNKIYYNQL